MVQPLHNPPGDDLERLVLATRRRMRAYWVITGIGIVAISVIATLLIAAAIDALAALPVAGRVVTLVVAAAVVAVALMVTVVWPVMRRVEVNQVAHRIERAVGGAHNRLITLLDLRRQNGRADATPAFVERVVSQARDRLRDYRVHQVADPQPVRRSLAIAVAVAIVVGAIFIWLSPRLPNALARIVKPTAPIAPVTGTELLAPGDLSVLQGEALSIEAATAGESIDNLELHLCDTTGVWHRHTMTRKDDEHFELALAGMDSTCTYKLVGGGTWSPTYRIDVAQRPIVRQVRATLRWPDYLGQSGAREVDPDADQIVAPVGSTLHIEAEVAGDAARGEVRLSRAELQPTGRMITDEVIWLEDDAPADAELIGTWHWVTDQVFSGYRSHTFDWRRQPYGFNSRLSVLDVPAGASLFMYVNIDPEEPPLRVSVTVRDADRAYQLIWGEPEAASAAAVRERWTTVHAGPLPSTAAGAGWARVAVPVERLTSDATKGVKLTGVEFNVETGRIWFDRLGYFTQRMQMTRGVNLIPVAHQSLERDADSGAWRGDVELTDDVHASLIFFSAKGHPSVATRPIAITATPDHAPTVAIERPGAQVTIAKPAPMPVVVRAGDDFGLESVVVQTSTDLDAWRDAGPDTNFDTGMTHARLTTALDVAARRDANSATLYYRVVARDRKGQTTATAPHRVTIGNSTAPGDDPEAAFKALANRLTDMTGTQASINKSLEELMASLPEGVKPFAEGKDVLRNADGSAMSAEQMRQFLAAFDKALTEAQQKQLGQLDDLLAQQQAQASDMAGRLAEAARQAQQSPTAAPLSAQALASLAQRMQQLAMNRAMMAAGDQKSLDKMRQLSGEEAQGKDPLAEMQAQLEQMIAAQQALGTDPQAVEAAMQRLLTEMRANQALQAMGDLQSHLQEQHNRLSRLESNEERLQDQARGADGATLEHVSESQTAFDPDALGALAMSRDLLRERYVDLPETPKAPWAPPREDALANLNPKDPAFKDKTPEEIAAELAKKLDPNNAKRDPQWWDKRMAPPTAEDKKPPAPMKTPREMLDYHQEHMRKSLDSNAAVSERMASQLDGSQDELGSAMTELRATKPTDEAGRQATQRVNDMLESRQIRSLMQMAQRAARQRASSSMASQQSGDGQTDGGQQRQPGGKGKPGDDDELRRGVVQSADLSDIELGQAMDRLYRLPPELRRPLLDAMKERGPAAYQPLIDAYFRQLSEQAP